MNHALYPMTFSLNIYIRIACSSLTLLSAGCFAQGPLWFPTGATYTYIYTGIVEPPIYQTSLEITEQTWLGEQNCAKMELV
jgi:hypothetical protein